MIVQESRDLRDRDSVLHDVEKQVAAAAHAVEVGVTEQHFRLPVIPNNCLTNCANIFRSCAIAALRDERARFDDRTPRGFAVETNTHDAVRLQQRE